MEKDQAQPLESKLKGLFQGAVNSAAVKAAVEEVCPPVRRRSLGTAHSLGRGNRQEPFGEVFRTLKPGRLFAGSDWCMTSRYRPDDPEHERLKQGMEKGDGIPNLQSTNDLDAALKDAGFQILETRDLAEASDPQTPWYLPLASGFSLSGFRNSKAGKKGIFTPLYFWVARKPA